MKIPHRLRAQKRIERALNRAGSQIAQAHTHILEAEGQCVKILYHLRLSSGLLIDLQTDLAHLYETLHLILWEDTPHLQVILENDEEQMKEEQPDL